MHAYRYTNTRAYIHTNINAGRQRRIKPWWMNHATLYMHICIHTYTYKYTHTQIHTPDSFFRKLNKIMCST